MLSFICSSDSQLRGGAAGAAAAWQASLGRDLGLGEGTAERDLPAGSFELLKGACGSR